jgi:hypothetical protein
VRLSPMALVVCCASCSERSPEEEGGPGQESAEDRPFTAVFHAQRLGQPVSLQVLLLPQGAILADIVAEDPNAFIAGGPTDAPMPVDEGDWSAQAGNTVEGSGLFEGQAYHDDDDSNWIAAPHDFSASRGGTLEHTFELNFLVTGWWECCSYAEVAVCGMDNVDYREGRVALLPGLGEVEVTGMSFTGTQANGDTIEGQFLGAEAASAIVTRTDGSTYDGECCKGSCP